MVAFFATTDLEPLLKKILVECEQILDSITVNGKAEDGSARQMRLGEMEWDEDAREDNIIAMACRAIMSLLGNLKDNIALGLQRGLSDGLLEAEAFMASSYAKAAEGNGVIGAQLSRRDCIKETLERETSERRKYLTELLDRVPLMRKPKGGRPERITKKRLLDAIEARRSKGAPVIAKGLALDLDENADSIRKAAERHKVELEPEE